jgi:hypothetical protein
MDEIVPLMRQRYNVRIVRNPVSYNVHVYYNAKSVQVDKRTMVAAT